MAAGLLRSKYLSDLRNAKYPFEYFLVLNEYMLYELSVIKHNFKSSIMNITK